MPKIEAEKSVDTLAILLEEEKKRHPVLKKRQLALSPGAPC